jgi:hypothetical protein
MNHPTHPVTKFSADIKAGRSEKLSWLYWLAGNVIGLIVLWFCWPASLAFNWPIFVSCSLSLLTITALAIGPIIHYFAFDRRSRYYEIRARIGNTGLIFYLKQFWESRTMEHPKFSGWIAHDNKADGSQATERENDAFNRLIQEVFDSIYTQYFEKGFLSPIIVLFSVILLLTLFSILLVLEKITLTLGIHENVVIGSIAGAYLFVVSDMVLRVRRRNLNSSTLYWYAIRMFLAIPIGAAITAPLEVALKAPVAFALGALPLEEILKLLRRLVGLSLNDLEKGQNDHHIIKLEGVTTRIASLLAVEGIDSIEQIIGADPIFLSARTGLSINFVFRLISQSLVRKHLGETASKLIPLGLADALPIATLVNDLDNTSQPSIQQRAQAALAVAASYIYAKNDAPANTLQMQSLEFNFRQITQEKYTHILYGVVKAAPPKIPR